MGDAFGPGFRPLGRTGCAVSSLRASIRIAENGPVTWLPLDHWIFGNGHGFKSPFWDNRFLWLDGELYTFNGWLGAQLHSVQWTHPKAQEERLLNGLRFRPFSSHRKWGRVYVSWRWADLPMPLPRSNLALEELRSSLLELREFRWETIAQGMSTGTAKTLQAAEGRSPASPVAEGHAPKTQPQPQET